MTNVIIYCRVSTDDQAEGYSLEEQERRLRAYCARNEYNVLASYREEYSAKHYDLRRPQLKAIFDYCKRHKGEVDKLLFLRWDRFTRNVEFGMTYKRKFMDEMGIEINSIENRIDYGTPNWATLFAMYCGQAHTEDETISRRTKDGIHGTLMDGKCSGRAPLGYKNVRVSKHDCWVEIDNGIADKLKAIFVEVAKGVETPTLIKNRLYPTLPDSTLFRTLRNRFYAGYIHVPEYEGFKEMWVAGKHEPLIDEDTFWAVQDVLDSNRKQKPKLAKKSIDPKLYLRKFLICPHCGHSITGARSKGNGGYYHYYFCNKDHKHLNIRAEKVNDGFSHYVSSLRPHPAILELYREILQDVRGDRTKSMQCQVSNLRAQLDEINARIERINDKYFDGEITKEDRISSLEKQNRRAEELKNQIQILNISVDPMLKEKIQFSVNIIENLGKFLAEASPEVKVKLLGSMFPEKIEFDGENYRTKSYNQILDCIFQETNRLTGEKKESDSESHSQNHLG